MFLAREKEKNKKGKNKEREKRQRSEDKDKQNARKIGWSTQYSQKDLSMHVKSLANNYMGP